MGCAVLITQSLWMRVPPKFTASSKPYQLVASQVVSTRSTKLNLIPKSSSQGVSSELVEEPKFAPLNADDPQYGPPALLLLGFEIEEATKIQQFLKDMDGDFLQIIFCTQDMISQPLGEAVNTKQSNLDSSKIAKSVPRICFLSGLTGEEMMMFIDAFPETGLEPAVFAALVPNNADKLVEELVQEIMGDHEMMCKVCKQTFICTTSEAKCKEHAEAKHPKVDLVTCFPN